MFRKLLLIAAAACVVAGGQAATTPVFDTASTNSGTSNLFVNSHTTSGISRFLLIDIGYDPTTSDPVTLVTYNGTTATELYNAESSDQGLYVYYVVDPNIGANPVSVFLSASVKCAIGVRSYTGVCGALPIGDSAGVTVDGLTGAVTVTTTEDNSLVLGTAAWEGSGVITEDASQTERYGVVATGGGPASRTTQLGDDEEKVTAGAVEMSYSYTISNPAVIHAVEIHPPSAGDTPTPTPTITATPEFSPTPVYQDYKRLIWKGHPVTFAEGTAALLLFENNVDDATGLTANWLNTGPVPFNGTTYEQGSYSIGPFAANESVTNTITAEIKTVEFYINLPGTTDFTDDRAWTASDDVHMAIRFDRASGQASTRIFAGGWSGTYNLSDDTWYDIGAVLDDGSDFLYYIDNVERLTLAGNDSPTNVLHYIGCGLNGAVPLTMGLMDEMRFSTDVKTSFPTED